jgi:uncharacterized membrane protein YfcA
VSFVPPRKNSDLRPRARQSAAACAYHGAIGLPPGPAMLAGSHIGSHRGAHYSSRIGNVWIKRIFAGIVLIMVMKLLMDA